MSNNEDKNSNSDDLDSEVSSNYTNSDEFISVASHQLRAPLVSMRWNLEMLMSGDVVELPQEAKNIVNQIYKVNMRMVGLVNDMLNVSRIDRGKIVHEPEPTDVVEIIYQAVEELSPDAVKHLVSINLEEIKTPIPKVSLDPKHFREAIENLLSNSIKYNKENGEINIRVKAENEGVSITISDTGMGIPKKEQNKIFSKFYRASNAREQEAEGSGLGLYVVKSYIEEWGGKVSFNSEEGKGTTFDLFLPVQAKEVRVES